MLPSETHAVANMTSLRATDGDTSYHLSESFSLLTKSLRTPCGSSSRMLLATRCPSRKFLTNSGLNCALLLLVLPVECFHYFFDMPFMDIRKKLFISFDHKKVNILTHAQEVPIRGKMGIGDRY